MIDLQIEDYCKNCADIIQCEHIVCVPLQSVLLLKSGKEREKQKGNKKLKRAMIFVKGNNTETQRAICEAYAKKNGYTVKRTTDSLQHAFDSSVEYDVLITAGKTRISRLEKSYNEIVEMFDELGITVLIAD